MTFLLTLRGFILMGQPAGQPGQESNPLLNLLPLLLMGVVFYFFLIRPQSKRRKEREAQISKVEKGDKIVTSSGIHGKVTQVEDSTILVEVADNMKIRFEKSAISSISPRG